MAEKINLEEHISRGVERIVTDAVKATLKDPRESAFMLRFSNAAKKATKIRKGLAEKGEHIPSFLIASITSSCNLHCAGCYSRCNEQTVDTEPLEQLTKDEWKKIFSEAESLGVSFIMLAGGEPLLRKDVITCAADFKNILFPIFTNGTYISDDYLKLFYDNRNLMPIISIEGNRENTDKRRGEGIYDMLISNMNLFKEKNILFGCSVTVTTENITEITSKEFVKGLYDMGCKVVFFIEFVPVTEDSLCLAPTDKERSYLDERMNDLRSEIDDIILLSFPGDEKADGGCMAAGRGFFHINSHGGAEPCPFSPYSDVNVKEKSLREAMKSKLFLTLRENGYLDDDHVGGCVLFEKKEEVLDILKRA